MAPPRAMSWMWRFFSPRERVLPSAASFMLPLAGPESIEGYANALAGTRAESPHPAWTSAESPQRDGRPSRLCFNHHSVLRMELDDAASQEHAPPGSGCGCG